MVISRLANIVQGEVGVGGGGGEGVSFYLMLGYWNIRKKLLCNRL